MKLGIASDHRGYETKEKIKEYYKEKYEFVDCGTDSLDRVDYPLFGFKLGELVSKKEVEYGIAICGSAVGISIACNKVKGVRCGKINDEKEAIHAKENDFVNVIAISGEAPLEENIKIIDAYLAAKENTLDPAYLRRKEEIENYENNI